MRYLIMMTHSPDDPVQEWTPDDVKASWVHMQQIHQDLTEAGELIAAEKLAPTCPAKRSGSCVPCSGRCPMSPR
jgi:hypothetical protein